MKLLTWNTQGERWEGIKNRIDSYEPDVFCIQEAGNLPDQTGFMGDTEFIEPTLIGNHNAYKIWFMYWDRKEGDGNIRCSMAMIFKDEGVPAVSWSTDTYKRPLMRKSIGNFYVTNIHAGGREYINQAIQQTRTNAGEKRWIVAGDFNQGANEDLLWMENNGGAVIAPNEATRPSSGRILDYVVSSDNKGVASIWTPDYGCSDHRCVKVEWLSRR
ncbi:MAG: hypothetical protein HGA46_07030 [Chlorobiaceae bacterium]|nr:hypothetical protein [Chlorobiaceae bacterium]